MRVGQSVEVRAYKADGTCYRWWNATVEGIAPDRVVVVSPAGHRVEAIDGGWTSAYAIRGHYWLDRRYSLLEVYAADGTLVEVYVNVSSPPEIGGAQIRFTDYELDVTREPPHEARLVDEGEFMAAAARYGYSEEFRRACYEVAKEAIEVANGWHARGMPTPGAGEA